MQSANCNLSVIAIVHMNKTELFNDYSFAYSSVLLESCLQISIRDFIFVEISNEYLDVAIIASSWARHFDAQFCAAHFRSVQRLNRPSSVVFILHVNKAETATSHHDTVGHGADLLEGLTQLPLRNAAPGQVSDEHFHHDCASCQVVVSFVCK